MLENVFYNPYKNYVKHEDKISIRLATIDIPTIERDLNRLGLAAFPDEMFRKVKMQIPINDPLDTSLYDYGIVVTDGEGNEVEELVSVDYRVNYSGKVYDESNYEPYIYPAYTGTKIVNKNTGKVTLAWPGGGKIKLGLNTDQFGKPITSGPESLPIDREPVNITYPYAFANAFLSCGIFYMPVIGSECFVGFSSDGFPVILGYRISDAYRNTKLSMKTSDNSEASNVIDSGYVVPRLELGEIMFKSFGQSYIYLRNSPDNIKEAGIFDSDGDLVGINLELFESDIEIRHVLGSSIEMYSNRRDSTGLHGVIDIRHASGSGNRYSSYKVEGADISYASVIETYHVHGTAMRIYDLGYGIKEDHIKDDHSIDNDNVGNIDWHIAGNKHILVLQDDVEEVQGNKKQVIEGNYDIEVDGSVSVVASDNIEISAEGASDSGIKEGELTLRSGANISILSDDTIKIETTNLLKIKVEGEGNIEIDATNVKLNAVGNITVGANKDIKIEGKGKINIKSGNIMVGNSNFKKLVNETFMNIFNSHTHGGVQGGLETTTGPLPQMTTSNLTEALKGG